MSISNRQIKHKEIFKVQQRLIKICGDFKKAQQELLLAFNECALAEVCHYNSLKKAVVTHQCKQAIKHYFKVYGDKFIAEEQLEQLKEWKPQDESQSNNTNSVR